MGNPLALLGLLAIAIPIVIHLLGRHQSRIERFPTLRFIGRSRLNPTRRRRLSDIPLLLVRVAIIAAAAIALSQPVFRDSTGSADASISRVIIVDTSASTYRLTAAGPVATLRARAIADSLSVGVVGSRVETAWPADAIDGAIAWLSTRAGLREIAIVSDFQRSSIDSASIAGIPAGIGVMLAPIATTATEVARVRAEPSITTLVGPSELTAADAAWRAIGRARPSDSTARVAIIYRSYPGAERLASTAASIDSLWIARLLLSLKQDHALAFATASAPGFEAKQDGDRLLLFLRDDAASLTSVALNEALVRAMSPAVPAAERDPAAWTSADLARWQRIAVPTAARSTDASDARWFWALCLALLALETWMRSRRRSSADVVELAPPEERAA